jgi:methylthioribulose-1-phosphate dehydratase
MHASKPILTACRRTWRDRRCTAPAAAVQAGSVIIDTAFGADTPARNTTLSYSASRLASCAEAIVAAGRKLGARGLTPATSSNFSMRLDDSHIAVTVSGRDKGALTTEDIMVVDLDGDPVGTAARPSAETLLHTHIYRRFAEANAVLHTHSRAQTVASRLFAAAGVMRLDGYELLKVFAGQTTHETHIDVPVFPNTQHMPDLVADVDAWIQADKPLYGYLIEGHGIYTWGRDMAETERHVEAFEFLIDCELELRRLRS